MSNHPRVLDICRIASIGNCASARTRPLTRIGGWSSVASTKDSREKQTQYDFTMRGWTTGPYTVAREWPDPCEADVRFQQLQSGGIWSESIRSWGFWDEARHGRRPRMWSLERAARDTFVLSPLPPSSRFPLWTAPRTSVPLQFYPPATPSSSFKETSMMGLAV